MISKQLGNVILTSNAGKKLTSKTLYLAAWERHKTVALEKIKNTLAEQIRDDANVVPEIESIPEVYAFVAILSIVL